jgi:hypothetical protein
MEPAKVPEETTMKYLIPALCLGFAISLSAASAETATKTAPKPRSAKSIECSKLADAKGLHGKERRVFRAKCKKGEPTT